MKNLLIVVDMQKDLLGMSKPLNLQKKYVTY